MRVDVFDDAAFQVWRPGWFRIKPASRVWYQFLFHYICIECE